MKLPPLRAQESRLVETLHDAVSAAPKGETPAAWLETLGPRGPAVAPASVTAGAKVLGKGSALFAVGMDAPSGDVKRLSQEVQAALRELTPRSTAADLKAALGKLGFKPGPVEDGVVRFTRGKAQVDLRPFAIGGLPAAELTVSKKGADKAKRGVYFQGTVFKPKQWAAFQERYQTEVARFVRAVKAGEAPLPDSLNELKAFLALGMPAAERAKEAAQEAELQAGLDGLSGQLTAMKAAGTAPRGVVVYVAGPDAAGKTSTGGIITQALEAAGYAGRSCSFKAPSAEERAQHWLKRFERGVPAEGEVVFWDRGPAGDSVYGPADDARAKVMGREFDAFEAELRAQGILLVKVELSADPMKQAATFGKRLARQHIAARLESALAAQGLLTGEAQAGLAEVKGKLDTADFDAFERYDAVQARFIRFVEASGSAEPWMVIDATQRHAARLALMEGFGAALERFARDAGA